MRREELIAGLGSQLCYFQSGILQSRDTYTPEQIPVGADFQNIIFAIQGDFLSVHPSKMSLPLGNVALVKRTGKIDIGG
jgi:hypothetical protein